MIADVLFCILVVMLIMVMWRLVKFMDIFIEEIRKDKL